MDRDDAVKLATAIAIANGHSHPQEWAEKVGAAWDALENPPAAAPPADDSADTSGEGA